MPESNPVLAKKRNVRHGAHGHYDLRLLRTGDAALQIEVKLTIFFDHVPNEDDQQIVWTQAERDSFAAEWRQQIAGTWNRGDYTTYRGHSLSLAFDCDVRTTAANTQWQVRIFKMKDSSQSRTSSVGRNLFSGNFDAELDSNDGLKKPLGDGTQTAMIHEFGHMIGNPDEYNSSSTDKPSIMHSGSAVRDRHLAHLVSWARPHIDDLVTEDFMADELDRSIRSVQRLARTSSAAVELDAAQAWRDGLAPGHGARFAIRRRETHEPIPIDQVRLEDYASLEVVFVAEGAAEDAAEVWQPLSAEAFETIFVE